MSACRSRARSAAHTTVLELPPAKREDALRLGADDFRLASDPGCFSALANSFDLIISTVPANVDLDAYLGLLARDGDVREPGGDGQAADPVGGARC